MTIEFIGFNIGMIMFSCMDLHNRRLNGWLLAWFGALGFWGSYYNGLGWIGALAGASCGIIHVSLFSGILYEWRGTWATEIMGGGDAWLIAAMGLWVGWMGIVSILAVATLMAATWREIKGRGCIPFVPFLYGGYMTIKTGVFVWQKIL